MAIITPNMNLSLPVVGEATGPDYATELNTAFYGVDQHNHTAGNGVQITPSGMDISSDLAFGNNNATGLRSCRLQVQSAVLSLPSDLDCLYVVGVDLYYNDGNGNNVRITQSGGVAGTPGSIASLASPASATYVSGSQTFVWQSAASTAANMDCGSVILREVAASANGVTLTSPSALASSYSVTFPSAPPAATHFMSMDASGNLGVSWVVDNSTLEVSSNTVRIKAAGITTSQISNTAGITGTQIASATIASSNMGAANYVVSSSCGVFSTNSSSVTQVTNLTATITLGGRPVSIFLQPDGSGSVGGGVVSFGSVASDVYLYFYKDGVELAQWLIKSTINVPASSFRFEDTAGSTGSHTYTCRVKSNGSQSIFVIYATLVVRDF